MYASRIMISGALHLGIFEQPAKETFSTNMLFVHEPFFPRASRPRSS
jgi:hypothetical protein